MYTIQKITQQEKLEHLLQMSSNLLSEFVNCTNDLDTERESEIYIELINDFLKEMKNN